MGRPRSFDEHEVLARCADAFRRWGYAATSMDALVEATRLQRGSIYGAYGSKRGLFLAALRAARDETLADLVLIALLELAPTDTAAHRPLADAMSRLGDAGTPEALGRRLVERARMHPAGAAGGTEGER